jgi:hypothetical protein
VTADPRVALAAGLALLAVAAALVLSRSPPVLAGTNAVHPVNIALGSVPGAGSACQAGETLPAGTTAIAISLEASAGPRVTLTVRSGKRVLASGRSASGWLGTAVAIPVGPPARTVRDATVCVAFAGAEERVTFLGVRSPEGSAARGSAGVLAGRMTIEYLRPGRSSWWSSALTVARRMGLGRAWAGAWVAVLVAALMALCAGAASWLALRESR